MMVVDCRQVSHEWEKYQKSVGASVNLNSETDYKHHSGWKMLKIEEAR